MNPANQSRINRTTDSRFIADDKNLCTLNMRKNLK